MAIKSFFQYLESQDATTAHYPTSTEFRNPRNKSFESVVDPYIKEFLRQVVSNTLTDKNATLGETQINYIINKIQMELGRAKYDANNDLGKIITQIWRQGNMPSTNDNQKAATQYNQNR